MFPSFHTDTCATFYSQSIILFLHVQTTSDIKTAKGVIHVKFLFKVHRLRDIVKNTARHKPTNMEQTVCYYNTMHH